MLPNSGIIDAKKFINERFHYLVLFTKVVLALMYWYNRCNYTEGQKLDLMLII
jgi:hypothetical protein